MLPCDVTRVLAQHLPGSSRSALALTDRTHRDALQTRAVWRVTSVHRRRLRRPLRHPLLLRWTEELTVYCDDADPRLSHKTRARTWWHLRDVVADSACLRRLRVSPLSRWRMPPCALFEVALHGAVALDLHGTIASHALAVEPAADLAHRGRLAARGLVVDTGAPHTIDACRSLRGVRRVEVTPGPSDRASALLARPAWAGVVTTMDLSGCHFATLPAGIAHLRALRSLRVDGNARLTDVGALARGPPALSVLSLDDAYRLTQFPPRLAAAASLRTISVRRVPTAAVDSLGRLFASLTRLREVLLAEDAHRAPLPAPVYRHPCFPHSALACAPMLCLQHLWQCVTRGHPTPRQHAVFTVHTDQWFLPRLVSRLPDSYRAEFDRSLEAHLRRTRRARAVGARARETVAGHVAVALALQRATAARPITHVSDFLAVVGECATAPAAVHPAPEWRAIREFLRTVEPSRPRAAERMLSVFTAEPVDLLGVLRMNPSYTACVAPFHRMEARVLRDLPRARVDAYRLEWPALRRPKPQRRARRVRRRRARDDVDSVCATMSRLDVTRDVFVFKS